jgi:hypothetical protein
MEVVKYYYSSKKKKKKEVDAQGAQWLRCSGGASRPGLEPRVPHASLKAEAKGRR